MPKLPGHHILSGIEYIVRAPGNIPFCHGCRQRVDAVTVVSSLTAQSPVHLCEGCIQLRLSGFDSIPK